MIIDNKNEILSQYVRTKIFFNDETRSLEETVLIIEDELEPQMCRASLTKEIEPLYYEWLAHYEEI